MSEALEHRVARQFSSLYLTLVSVLVGLVLSDLFSEIHERMTLWPLTLENARTWCQIFGNSLAVLSSWVTYSHLGLLRNRLPTIWDTVDAMLVLVTVPLNAVTGRHDAAAWFFWAAAFLLLDSPRSASIYGKPRLSPRWRTFPASHALAARTHSYILACRAI